jgi:hypothetical protein
MINNFNPNHAMILPRNANPKPDGIFGKDRFSTSSRRGGLNRSAMKVASRWIIANIASDDALILPHRANPAGLNFRERQGCRQAHSRRVDPCCAIPIASASLAVDVAEGTLTVTHVPMRGVEATPIS